VQSAKQHISVDNQRRTMCHWLKQFFATCTATRQNASESQRRPHLALSHWHWFYFTCKHQLKANQVWKQELINSL